MDIERAKIFRPVAPPRVIEGAYSADQHQRMLEVVRDNGPWQLIIAQHFSSAEELIATTSGQLPEGVTPSLDMFLSPVFRGYFTHHETCIHPDIEDCFYNPKFLKLVRDYWQVPYAEPEMMLFNIQGPCADGGSPHVDGTEFRGLTHDNCPVWLANIMVKTGLFKRWQSKKAQVIAWYYKGRIGGGFTYWPDGPHEQPKQIKAPMWGRAVVVENEMMYHSAQSNGPAALRKPQGLAFNSLMEADPEVAGGWRITTDGKVIQRIPEEEFRFLVHWSAKVYSDLDDLKKAKDHTDDLGFDQVFDILFADLKKRGVVFDKPSDPLSDQAFIGLLTSVYDPGRPLYFPPEPEEAA